MISGERESFPSCIQRGFDSLRRPLQTFASSPRPPAAGHQPYLSPPIARRVTSSQDDGAETWADRQGRPGAVPGAST